MNNYEYLRLQFEAECEEVRNSGLTITPDNFELCGFNPDQYPFYFW